MTSLSIDPDFYFSKRLALSQSTPVANLGCIALKTKELQRGGVGGKHPQGLLETEKPRVYRVNRSYATSVSTG